MTRQSSAQALIEFAAQQREKELQSKVTQLTSENKTLMRELLDLERQLGYAKKPVKAPRWLMPKKRKLTAHHAIPTAICSDNHLDEVVDPAEMSGHNAFNREIGTMRLRNFFEDCVKIPTHYWTGIQYDGFCLIGGGDLFTGQIHDELDRTNDGKGVFESLDFWTPQYISGITLLADTYGHVYSPWTVGNHGRIRNGRWQHKLRVVENMDWALGKRLADHFANDDRVQFFIPEDTDVPFNVYSTRYMLNHGVTGGGSGIGGIFPPIFRLLAGLRKRWEFDIGVLGHWHQNIYTPEQGLIINGALKGYDDFSRDMHFKPERASQSIWLTTPEHGPTWHAGILVTDKKAEGW